MFPSLKIGRHLFPSQLVQGPLAGVSCAPFRLLTWRYSQPAFTYTEMISCKTIIHQPQHALERFIKKEEGEGPVCFQLSGTDPHELSEAVKRVTDYGADLIDLNCGCPVKKIRQRGAGSKLLTQPTLLYDLIHSMKQSTPLPVSIKIRVQGLSDEKTNADILKVVNDSGLDFLTVHGRHWTENYDTPCRYDEIAYFVKSLSLPIIGNGDIACPSTLGLMLKTGCAGAMIGRAGVGQPWLIAELKANQLQIPFTPPSINEIGLLFVEHVERLASLLKNDFFALLQARKFAKYYARPLAQRQKFAEAINTCHSLMTLKQLTYQYFA